MIRGSKCDVTDLTDTEIVCVTGSGSMTHNVTNGGVNPGQFPCLI